jgi:hypothetical protein
MSTARATTVSPVLMRAMVWSLIGLIYAPLFVVMQQLLSPALPHAAPVLSAATAGAIGATFYGARQLALAASLIGVGCGTAVLLIAGPAPAWWLLVAVAAGTGLATGVMVRFPHRCTLNIGRKFLIGGSVGALAGAVLLALNLLLSAALPVAASVAFLVSVNGVLYVAALDAWRSLRRDARPRFCDLTEGAVIAVIALFIAASMTAFAGIFADDGQAGGLTRAMLVAIDRVPFAVLGGVTAGAITGGLLELFEFNWVDDAE